MTGKHTGHASVRGNKKPELGLGKKEATVASLLKSRGYKTALFGKWGLGGFDDRPEIYHGRYQSGHAEN